MAKKDISVDEAVAVLQRDYLKEVNEYAKDFDDRIAEGEWDDRDSFIQSMDEEIDGAQRVIYTYRARLGLLASDNEDAGIDEMGVDGFDWSAGTPYSALMYFAFRQDIMEHMDSDIDDDETFEEADEDEDE